MSTTMTAASTYRCDLGEGLIARWSTADDIEKIAQLCGKVFRESEEEPPNLRAANHVRRQMRGDYPLMGPGDYALVEDTRKDGLPAVACTCLWRSTWEYEGIPFEIGQPEFVATDSDYRRRGLIRALFKMIHARSEAEGHLVQAITGIPYFYRQFGYEYAIELENRRVTYVSLIPQAQPGTPEPYTLRAATEDDIPAIMDLYNTQRAQSEVWSVAPENFWRYQLEEGYDLVNGAKPSRVQMLVDRAGVVQGYVLMAVRRLESDLIIWAVDIVPGANWQEVILPLLRALQSYGMQIPTASAKVGPLRGIGFFLGSAHPIYEVMGQTLAPLHEWPYAWYVRVPNLPAFLQHIAPALERRLAASWAANYTGELKLDLYRSGLRLIFDKGRLRLIEPWHTPLYGNDADLRCSDLVFLQLLFGHHSLDELRFIFPDVLARNNAEGLLKALFPKKFSWVMPLP